MLKPNFTLPDKSMLPFAARVVIICSLCFSMSFSFVNLSHTSPQWIAVVIFLLGGVLFLWYRLYRTLRDYQILKGEQKALMEENSRLTEEIRDLWQNVEKDSAEESNPGITAFSQEEEKSEGSEMTEEEDPDPEQETEDKGGSMMISQVSHVWVQGNYIHYKIKDRPRYHMRRDSLKNVYARLQQHDFVQTHKSYLINLAMVKQVRGQEVILEDGSKVPLSRKYKEAFREEYKRYDPIDF
jgi:hypothetical protein